MGNVDSPPTFSHTGSQPADAARILVEALEGTPSLVVIDDFHKVSDMVLHQTFQAMSLALLGSEEKIGLVIFSRSFKPVVLPRTQRVGSPVWCFHSTVWTLNLVVSY